MSRDKDELDEFQGDRQNFVQRKKDGCKQGFDRSSSSKRNIVSRKRTMSNDLLIPPEDKTKTSHLTPEKKLINTLSPRIS